jgi:glutamate/tyrosine decarboxylase-like PLP-dependent enzyme
LSSTRRDERAGERSSPLEMQPEEFRRLGHRLVDQIADWLGSLRELPLTRDATPRAIRELLGRPDLPQQGEPAGPLLDEAGRLLFQHSLFNGHPRFWGYITASAAPVGALGDLLASAVNANVGAWELAPVASEIEARTVGWIAELIGFPSRAGLLVSGGNMANFIGFFAARRAAATWDIRAAGLHGDPRPLAMYASTETHTWIQKATDLSGMGTSAIRWIDTDADCRMDVDALRRRIAQDREAGMLPFLVVGNAGTVGTGAIDPLPALAEVCREERIWFHVDGAYGGPAAVLPEAPDDLRGLACADSVALDPHKWLYSPVEAGCALVRERRHLVDAFSFRPAYYRFEGDEHDPSTNYYELGLQNSRGFRALKVWLGLRQAGREGYCQMIRDDIALATEMHRAVREHEELEALTCNLSIVTLRYVPRDLSGRADALKYVDELNERLLARLKVSGEAFVSNTVLDGRFVLRACVVNFRTERSDVRALPAIVARIGREVDRQMRPASGLAH